MCIGQWNSRSPDFREVVKKPYKLQLQFFFIIFRNAYNKMQNGLKRMFFMKEKNFGSKGKVLKNIGKMFYRIP